MISTALVLFFFINNELFEGKMEKNVFESTGLKKWANSFEKYLCFLNKAQY
jgi:hypothetical protein